MDEVTREESPQRKSKAESNAEYFASLEKWLNEVRSMSMTCNLLSFPFGMMMGPPPISIPGIPLPPPPMPQFPVPPMFFPPDFQNQLPNFMNGNLRNGLATPQLYVEYRVPPLWKRFAAELIDFLLLFLMKLAVTFVAMDFLNFIDFEKYDFDLLQKDDKLDYKVAIEMTSEIIALEIFHRIIVCAYETSALCQSIGDQPGGTTAGKAFMGLRVVSAKQIVPGNEANVVRVSPATTLTFGQSLSRALLKNLVIILFFPVCFSFIFNRFNRTGYDIVSNCIVVEERAMPGRQRR